MSDATKTAISTAHTGKAGKPMSDAIKTVISAAHTGKPMSEETKNAISASKRVKSDKTFDANILQWNKLKKTNGNCDVNGHHDKSLYAWSAKVRGARK